MAEVLKAYETKIERVGLVPSDGGRFEVTVNGQLLYSKLETGRHLEEGQVVDIVGQYLEDHG